MTKRFRSFLIIDLLDAFSERELSDLSHFVSCKYFNTDKYVVALLAVLRKEVKKELAEKLEFVSDEKLNK